MKLRVAKKVLKRIRSYPWEAYDVYRRRTVAAAIFRVAQAGPSPKFNLRAPKTQAPRWIGITRPVH